MTITPPANSAQDHFSIDPSTTIGPVTLNVADLTAQTRFYRQIIGLQVRAETAVHVELGTAERPLIYLRLQENGRFVQGTTGLYHLALRVPNKQDLAHWLRHYIDCNGPHWQGASDHLVSLALYLADPEGNGIEIYWDRSQTAWHVDANGRIEMDTRRLDLEALLTAAPAAQWRHLSAATDMGHVHLKVADLAAARRFYIDLLGFGLKAQYGGSALFLAAGSYHHHIGLNTWHSAGATAPPQNAVGLAACTLVLPSVQAREHIGQRLQAAQYPFENAVDSILLSDPSGIIWAIK